MGLVLVQVSDLVDNPLQKVNFVLTPTSFSFPA